MKVYEAYCWHKVGRNSGYVVAPDLWTWGSQAMVCRLGSHRGHVVLDCPHDRVDTLTLARTKRLWEGW